MRQHHGGIWGVLALPLAFTVLVVALAAPAGSTASPVSVVIYDHGVATVVEPGSARYREMGAQAARLVQAARSEVAALALPWERAERCKREQVALEVVFAAPGVRAGVHGEYTAALVPLDEMHESHRVHVYLGTDRYTLLVPADADQELARLCELAGVPVPPVQRGPASPTVAPAASESDASGDLTATTSQPTPAATPSPIPGATVGGRVVEGFGAHRPVGGLPLWLGSASEGQPAAHTDGNGEFALVNVPPGNHEIVNSHLFFEVTVPKGAAEVDVGTLGYPLIHPPLYYYSAPAPLPSLEELLARGRVLEFTVCQEDGAWRRPPEGEQRERVWTQRPFSDLGEPVLQWWFERPALLYDAVDLFQQSFPGGPSLEAPGADRRYLLGTWNGAGPAGSGCAYDGGTLDDLVVRRQLEVWLLGYRAFEVRRLGEHYAVQVRRADGLQVIRFAGEEAVLAVHIVCDGVELACLPERPSPAPPPASTRAVR